MGNERLLGLQQENDQLRKENVYLKNRIQRDCMERAIKDDQLSKSIANNLGQFFKEPLAPWYVCVLFFGGRPSRHDFPMSPISPLENVSQVFSETMENYGQPYFFEASGTIACLLNVELEDAPDDTPEAGKAFCEDLRDALAEVHHLTHRQTNISHIAISHASRLEQGPRILYRSAVSVAERRTSNSPAVCVEERWLAPSTEPLANIFSLEPAFWRQIQQHAFFDAATTLDQLIQLTSLEQGSLERTLASVFSRMELVLQATMQESGKDPMHDEEFAELLPSLSEVETYQEMREAAYDILATLEDRFYTPPNSRNKKMANVEAYIAENYTDQLMCASSIADHFKISPSYLSRIFKADKDMGIVEYIHRIRVDAAKELLKDDSLTMDAVAVKAGFSNRWVLTRVFKKIVGTTPGAYRNDRIYL